MRLKYLDFLREIALFYMFFQHVTLALLKPQLNNGIIMFLFEIVPFCPALFLFLSGFSISLYLKKNNIETINLKYTFHLFVRGLILIICASFLFVVEHGFQFPDFIFCGNILNTIGWMIIISAAFLLLKNNKIYLGIFILLLLCLTIFLEINKIYIVPFNYGYEPISPTIIFGFIGLMTGSLLNEIKEEKNIKFFIIIAGILGLFIISYFGYKYGIFRVFFSDTGRYIVEREFNEKYLLQNVFNGSGNQGTYIAGVWNYNTECMIASIGLIFLIFSISFFLEKYIFKYLPGNIFIPGKFAFINYFYHLSVIAVMILIFNFNFMNKIQFVLFLICLFTISYILSFIAQFIKSKLKKRVN